jgi:hypothetical protein
MWHWLYSVLLLLFLFRFDTDWAKLVYSVSSGTDERICKVRSCWVTTLCVVWVSPTEDQLLQFLHNLSVGASLALPGRL